MRKTRRKKQKENKENEKKGKKTGRDARQIKCLTRKVCLHAPLNRTLPLFSGTVYWIVTVSPFWRERKRENRILLLAGGLVCL